MRMLEHLPLAATLCAAALSVQTAGAEQPAASAATVARDGNAFALDLHARLRAAQEGDLFFSPQSLSTALAMTYAGARGDTAAQMARTLHLSLPQDQVPAAYAALLQALNVGDDAGYRLSVANRLWGQRGEGFLDEFLAITRRFYGAELGQVDFRTDAGAARAEINAWVLRQTADKIRDLIPEGALQPTTRLVLTNAIYFRGDWATQFAKEATTEQPFHVTADRTLGVPLMFAKMRVGLAGHPEAGLTVAELPYRGDDVSMIVLLPDAVDGLAAVESQLAPERLAGWTSALPRQDVLVYLPRFSIESSFGLGATLSAMGMPLAFSGDADFSGIDGRHDLFISAVVHKARVDVDERGTEAAAATGVVVGLKAVRPVEPPTFRADHPFLFLIRHNPTGAILFLGRVTEPRP
jgi:serpin B